MEPTEATFSADMISAAEIKHGSLIWHDSMYLMRVSSPIGEDATHWVDIADGEPFTIRTNVMVTPVTIHKFEVEIHGEDV